MSAADHGLPVGSPAVAAAARLPAPVL